MAITDRNLAVGTKLWARYKGEIHTAEVVLNAKANDESRRPIAYRLADGREVKSPSAAGAAIMGEGRTCNGWAFWSTGEPTEKPAEEPKAPRSSAVNAVPKPERKARTRKPKTPTEQVPTDEDGHALPIIERLDDQFECGECGRSFATREEAAEHGSVIHTARFIGCADQRHRARRPGVLVMTGADQVPAGRKPTWPAWRIISIASWALTSRVVRKSR
jgi:hypothetical protein